MNAKKTINRMDASLLAQVVCGLVFRAPVEGEIKRAREVSNLTQGQAAKLVGAGSYRTWQEWEAGRRAMPFGLWELFCIKTGYRP